MIANGIEPPPVHRITLAQLAILVPASLLVWMIWGRSVGLSLVCGGLVAVLPQTWFAARLFRWRGASAAQQVARSALGGEMGKFLLSAVGFALVFALLRPIHPAAVFAGFIAMLAIQVTGSWLLLRR